MSKSKKLGRNPLQTRKARETPKAPLIKHVLDDTPAVSALEKIRQMKVSVDWSEFFRLTIGESLGKLKDSVRR